MSECPKCHAPYSHGDIDCKKCGIVFAKIEQIQAKQREKDRQHLITCKACEREFSMSSTKCPYCLEPKNNPSIITIVGGGFIIFCVFIGLFGEYFGMEKTNNSAHDLTTMAHIQCNNFVKDTLKSPSTADFPLLDYESNVATDNLYIIRSYVDAQNDFGATVRTNWRCKARYIGGEDADQRSWKLVDLQMYKR